MKSMKSPYACGLTFFLSATLSISGEMAAAPDGPGQKAGEVSRVIPMVNIVRAGKTISASAKTVVDWQDVVNTQASARARIALDDGSVLNVGSDSSIKVVKHDGGAQQTELELTYGKIRSQAQKITKPDGKFEVKTPAGVAGVVGTDFYTAFDSASGTMNVIVFEGIVKVCNLAGVCVVVKAGQMTSVRAGDNAAPLAPAQAPLDQLVDTGKSTDTGGQTGTGVQNVAPHIGKGAAIAIGAVSVLAVGVIVGVATHGSNSSAPGVPTKGCQPGTPGCP
jgi:hypothetical protein